MKKALVLGVILLAVSSLAFADFGTGMWGRTAFDLAMGQTGTGASTDITQQFGVSFWPPQPRENMNWWFSSDKASFNYTVYFNGAVPSYVNMYGTLKLVPDMASLQIGKFTGDGFDDFRLTSPHPIHDVNNNNIGRLAGWGILAIVAPKDSGFEGVLGWMVQDPTSATPSNTIGGNARNVAALASYTVPNLVKVSAGTTTNGALDDTTTHENNLDRNIFGRVQLLMIPNLTLWVDGRFWGFDEKPTTSTNIAAELAAAYSMDALTAVLAATVMSGSVGNVLAYAAMPEVYYNLGMATVGLYFNVSGSNISGSGIGYAVEPYVKLNDFNLRLSFYYQGNTTTGALGSWEIPLLIDFGF
jgi:hypothetical protein